MGLQNQLAITLDPAPSCRTTVPVGLCGGIARLDSKEAAGMRLLRQLQQLGGVDPEDGRSLQSGPGSDAAHAPAARAGYSGLAHPEATTERSK